MISLIRIRKAGNRNARRKLKHKQRAQSLADRRLKSILSPEVHSSRSEAIAEVPEAIVEAREVIAEVLEVYSSGSEAIAEVLEVITEVPEVYRK